MTSEPFNPVDIENRIREISERISRSVAICNETLKESLKATHDYDTAYAHAYLEAEGPAHKLKYIATLATKNERNTKNVKEVAHKFATDTARALENELRAAQSVGASIRSIYGVAGRGEGA